MFITLEGGEGSGKSTQTLRLVQRLRAEGRAAHPTREPGGTPLADAIRVLLLHPDTTQRSLAASTLTPPATPAGGDAAEPILPLTELLLLSAARTQHVARIRTWLAAGALVVCDRFADATRAYQGYGRGLDLAAIEAVERLATGGLRPDLTLLLDLPPAEGLARKRRGDAASDWNRLDGEALPFHERVRSGYLALAAAEPARWVVLDATLPHDELARAIWEAVATRLPAG
jgi:dTMP kinase